jgi:hypothetical protein
MFVTPEDVAAIRRHLQKHQMLCCGVMMEPEFSGHLILETFFQKAPKKLHVVLVKCGKCGRLLTIDAATIEGLQKKP